MSDTAQVEPRSGRVWAHASGSMAERAEGDGGEWGIPDKAGAATAAATAAAADPFPFPCLPTVALPVSLWLWCPPSSSTSTSSAPTLRPPSRQAIFTLRSQTSNYRWVHRTGQNPDTAPTGAPSGLGLFLPDNAVSCPGFEVTPPCATTVFERAPCALSINEYFARTRFPH